MRAGSAGAAGSFASGALISFFFGLGVRAAGMCLTVFFSRRSVISLVEFKTRSMASVSVFTLSSGFELICKEQTVYDMAVKE